MPDPKLQIILAAKDVTGAAFTKFQGRIKAVTKSVFSFKGALGSLAGAGGFGLLIDKSVSAADSIAKTSRLVGLSAEALQEYRYAAERSGVSTEKFDSSIQRFNRRLGEAATGKGELVKVLEQYNIAVTDASGNTRDTESVFNDLANAIQSVNDPAERARIAFNAFGREGLALVNMLAEGERGLDAYAQKARGLGVILENDLVGKSEAARDAFDDMGLVIERSFSRVILENVDSLTQGVEALAGAASTAIRMFSELNKWLDKTLGGKLDVPVQQQYLSNLRGQQQFITERFALAQRMGLQPGTPEYVDFENRLDLVNRKIGVVVGELVDKNLNMFFSDIDAAAAGVTPGAGPAWSAGAISRATGATPPASAASYSMTWGPGELARFAQYDVLVRDSEKAFSEMTQHVDDYQQNFRDSWEPIDSRITTTFSRASDALADFVTTGKFEFSSFATSLISDMIRINSQMALTDIFSGLTGLFTRSAAPVHVGAGGTTAFGFDQGGHIGEPVRGIGMRSGQSYEFHANETVIPDRKLGGGKSVVININNQSGVDLDAQQQTIREDPEKVIADIIVKRKMTNRGFRNALRS